MTDWYYADTAHVRQGPVPTDALLHLWQTGRIGEATLLWREGLAQWQPLAELQHELRANETSTAAADAGSAGNVLDSDTTRGAPTVHGWTAAHPHAGGTDPWPASPYAPPTAPVQRADIVVQGGEIVLAGFRKRLAAYLIDGLIVGIGATVIGMLVGGVIGGLMLAGGLRNDLGFVFVQVASQVLSLAVTAAYYAGFHASRAMATPGKMAVGIKVVRQNGERITVLRGVGRYFASLLSGLILAVGFLMAAFTARKQALHDMICDTLVVDRWAFTAHPEWQRRELGTVTIVVLVLFGALAAFAALAVAAAIGLAAFSR